MQDAPLIVPLKSSGNVNLLIFNDIQAGSGGETGIRTLEGCYTLLVFKTSAFNRSAIPPAGIAWLRLQVYTFSQRNCINYLLFA